MQRLTPMEIFNKDFKVSFRGYNINEVNDFLDLIIKNYEEVLKENEFLKSQLEKKRPLQNQDVLIQDILERLKRLEEIILKPDVYK